MPNQSQIILYTTPDGDVKVDTILQDETIWLNQSAMAELFDVNVPAIPRIFGVRSTHYTLGMNTISVG